MRTTNTNIQHTMHNFQQKLAQLKEIGQLRTRRTVNGPQGPMLNVDGRDYLAFCSNDYLGLANHPQLIAAAHAGLDRYGVGSAASALVCGHTEAHQQLETALAAFMQMPRALFFGNGYMANLGIIPALMGAGDMVFSDSLNHACLIDATRLSRADRQIYPHGDLQALETMLAASTAANKLIATDAVFSMDGDIAPLPQLLALCEQYDAWLLIDDAHGFGVLGADGRGSLSHFGLASPRVIYMGTLGKAAGVYGAFVAGEADLIEWLMQRARTYIFTTASPPSQATALCASLRIIEDEPWRRDHIRALAQLLRDGLAASPWRLMPSQTAIQPLLVGDNQAALDLMAALQARGIWAPAIRPPTVPTGTARLRISLSAAHSSADVAQLITALLALTHLAPSTIESSETNHA
ncbi:MAG: bioF [Herbaspirillum sp.]|jgi:8-amino-7-oxononanoate synthase|nr:bioF [Herbaspirillum sp.]